METKHRNLKALGAHLADRRDAILEAARTAACRDPEQSTVGSLTRAQFDDHIPSVLDAFARELRTESGRAPDRADTERNGDEIKHGLHRWQQGYRLRELLHEWGHLHLCIFDELEAFAVSHPEIGRDTIVEANRHLITLVNEAVSASAGQYARLQQDEAAGHVRDLQRTLSQVQELDRTRAKLIHQAVHDLRGNVQSVSSNAEVLRDANIPEAERNVFADSLQQGVDAMSTLVGDLMDLARLEAGQEQREISAFDASALIAEFCSVTQGVARGRRLYFQLDGPPSLPVEGDERKVRRILQNLVLNALKYTESGGVTVNWGADIPSHWWFSIQDTGPGLMAGPGSPMAGDLKEATAAAAETPDAGVSPPPAAPVILPAHQQPGEGIGLSIVKRLCELLDAGLELSSASQGTTFRVVLPLRYPPVSSPPAGSAASAEISRPTG